MWHQFVHLTTKLRLIHGDDGSDLELLRRTFPDLRYVFLTRRDKVRQAVSYYKAIKTGVWWLIRPYGDRNQEIPPPAPAPPVDFEQIHHWVTHLTFSEAEWHRHFERIGARPLKVAYEDFITSYESTVRAILRYLGLPHTGEVTVAPPRLQSKPTSSRRSGLIAIGSSGGRPSPSAGRPFSPRILLRQLHSANGERPTPEALESTRVSRQTHEGVLRPELRATMDRGSGHLGPRRLPGEDTLGGTTPDGVFAAKVHWHQFVHLTAKLRLIQGDDASGTRFAAAHVPRPCAASS